jgi:hypothetical protein
MISTGKTKRLEAYATQTPSLHLSHLPSRYLLSPLDTCPTHIPISLTRHLLPAYHTSLISLPPLPFPCYRNPFLASAPPNHFLPHGRYSLVGPCDFSPSSSLHITPAHTLSYFHLQSSHWSQTKTIHGLEASGWTHRSHWHRLRTIMGVMPNPNSNEDSYSRLWEVVETLPHPINGKCC